MEEKFARLKSLLGEIADLGGASSVLAWDQETYMPPQAAEARAKQMATLSRLSHRLFTSDEVGKLFSDLADWAEEQDYESFAASLVRVTRRDYEQAVKLPGDLVADLSEASGLALNAWVKAKHEADFASFRPHLEKIIELNRAKAEALGYKDNPYDALLDSYEPEMTTAMVEELFAPLKDKLIPLVREIATSGKEIDDSFLQEEYPVEKQWELAQEILPIIGFDLTRGLLDETEHPCTISPAIDDVRISTNIKPGELTSGLFAVIHEAGHGMYHQGIDKSLARTPLAGGASSGIHESQSRLWENLVGRSRQFWQYFYPRLQAHFPRFQAISQEDFYRAINRVQPSLIRVQADEVTYNLHIFLRFELEKKLVAGELPVSELPKQWNGLMEQYLGITPPDDGQGVLQDMHWAASLLGYFPTYTLGNVYSVQLYDKALAEKPEIPERIAAGDFASLREWMRNNIWALGRKLSPVKLLQRATGRGPDPAPYLSYIEEKYREIYGLKQ